MTAEGAGEQEIGAMLGEHNFLWQRFCLLGRVSPGDFGVVRI